MVINNGTINAHRYITSILEPHVMPFMPILGDNAFLMHDNARPHVAGIVNQYLAAVGIRTLDWPARSADLNPIEHLWDKLKRRVRNLERPPNNLEELANHLTNIWEELGQNEIQSLILSMRRRCEAVIRSRGGNTQY